MECALECSPRMEESDDMKRFVEQVAPYGMSLVLVVAYIHFGLQFPKCRDVLSASITLGAVFTGFLATLKSIVISVNSPAIQHLRTLKFWGLLLGYLQQAIWSSLTLCVISMAGFFYDPQNPPVWFGIAWVFVISAAIFTFLRVSNLIMKLLRHH